MTSIAVRDRSRAGHHLGGAVVHDLPAPPTLRDLLRARVAAEVEAYNRAPGAVFVGLVQPADAMRHSDGFRMAAPRPLDAEGMIAAALEAVEARLLSCQVGDAVVRDLDTPLATEPDDEVELILDRAIVARHG